MQSSSCILVNLYEVLTLIMHINIDLLRYRINVPHQLLYVIELFLPLLYYILHVVCLFPYVYFYLI